MSRRILPFAIALLLLTAVSVYSQISAGGKPISFSKTSRALVQTVTMPEVDVEAYLAEDQRDGKDVPYRFGAPFDVSYDLNNSGTWETLDDGSKLWRLTIVSEGAYSLNLLYEEFWLPERGKLFLYNSDRSYVIGAFTAANNKEHREFSTAPTKGDEVTLEYHQPASVTESAVIKISRVVHAYHNLFDVGGVGEIYDFGDAGSCNNNVNCPVGVGWEGQIRSVAMILSSGGFRLCSGSMVNNVRRDATPYFLTANHCLGGETTWIFMWNYQSPGCSNVDGPTWMTVQGSTLKATSTTSDFALLQLTEAPPDSYLVYFAGWSAENVIGDSSCGIHHPQGDIKKISFDYEFTQLTDYLGNGPGTTHIRIVTWNDGTTEPGSSGSPLFNKQKQVVGQLHGGFASCTSITSDWYGKFARSWLGGGTNATSLKPWLDPDNTGAMTLDGFDPSMALTVSVDSLYDTADTLNDYEVLAIIESDTALAADKLLLHYTISSVNYLDTMEATPNPDEYHEFIPAQSANTSISYFVTAANLRGDVDTSETITFQVLGYAVSLDPANGLGTGAVDDTVLHSLSVTNNGAIADDYDLSISGELWETDLLDSTGTFPVSASGNLLTGQNFDFKVRVIVPASNYGDNDQITVTAQSSNDVSTSDNAVLTTVSAGQPLAIPFFEEFASGSIEPANWVINANAEASTAGINEPSPPYSLNLNGNPSTRDTLVSQAINLSDQDSVVLSYYYQRTGGGNKPEIGDDLFVEYSNSSGQWILLRQHLGAGQNMITFEPVSILLNTDALHSAFRLRFRNIAGPAGASDDWYIDNIRVDRTPVTNATPAALNAYLANNDSTEKDIVITNDGQGLLNWKASIVYLDKRNKLFEELRANGEVQPATFDYPEEFFDYEDIKGLDDPREGYAVEKDAGGPDAFGYTWIDSDESGGPVFSWIDISGTGIDIVGDLNDDNFGGPYNIGFNFPFYENLFNLFFIGSNGIIGFSTDSMLSRYKTAIPNATNPDNFLAWMWDDLNPDDADNPGVHVYVGNYGGNYVIQFVNYPEYQANPGDIITAEIVLYPNGDILYQYLTVAAGFDIANSCIGIENSSGTDGAQVAFLTPYVKDNLAVLFTSPYRWVGLNKGSGSLSAGTNETIIAKFASGDLPDSTYEANIIITSNDPNGTRNPWTVPVQLTVSDQAPFLCGDVDNSGVFQGILELTYLVGYIFRGGPPPADFRTADLNGIAGYQGILELTYMVDFIFRSGPPPSCQ